VNSPALKAEHIEFRHWHSSYEPDAGTGFVAKVPAALFGRLESHGGAVHAVTVTQPNP
jgi:hypothetical protein